MKLSSAVMLAAAAALGVLFALGADAQVVGQGNKHDMTNIPGYPLAGVCSSCHRGGHDYSGPRLWESDRNAIDDNARNLADAKAMSADAPYGNYAGIYLCLDCHSASVGAPSWSKKSGNWAKNEVTHSTREMQKAGYATQRGNFVTQCTDCHDPHQTWNGRFAIGTNGYMVSPLATYSGNSYAVTFTARSGAGSLGTNSPPTTAICEVCHTRTLYHKNTASTPHYDGSNCLDCHSHSTGFGLPPAPPPPCNTCHGNPPTSPATLVGGQANRGGYPRTGAASAGSHAYHTYTSATGAGYECDVCHLGGMSEGAVKPWKKVIIVNFSFVGYTSGSFDGFAPISGYSFNSKNTAGGTLACRNTYCHGNFKGGNLSNKPLWTNTATAPCGSCHGTAPPALMNHSVHLTAPWGPKDVCEDCHPPNSSIGRNVGHAGGVKIMKDGLPLASTTVCGTCHGHGTATAKAFWGVTTMRRSTSWCESCHDGYSLTNTAAGTGGKDMLAENVVGDKITYGFDVTGHGMTGISDSCTNCHSATSPHIYPTQSPYKSSLNNYQAAYRLTIADTVPLLSNYSSTRFQLCYSCHIESAIVGMPAGSSQSAMHVHPPKNNSQWYTNFRNTSTTAGHFAGNYDTTVKSGYQYDIPTNIHWNHLDDYGSTGRGLGFIDDSDGDGTPDSHVTCTTCHDPHGTNQTAMVYSTFALKNHSVTPQYRWIGSPAFDMLRCNVACHSYGNAVGPAGTRWYREPLSLSTTYGVPQDPSASPLP
ncbi:MAG: CxxxxCH/CxxCH domain-containing protein [Nitrospirota bacterium]